MTTISGACDAAAAENPASGDDGPSALQAWQDGAPDVVVLDLTLPGLDGLQVLERARAGGPG